MTVVLGVRTYSGASFGTAPGSTDPTDIAYNPASRSFYVCDSEVDESPFFSARNLFRLDAQGQFQQGISLTRFTKEPTGLTFGADENTGAMRLFICDDAKLKIFMVDPAAPNKVLKSFSTTAFNCSDPEDLSFNPANGNLFVLSENNRRIIEVTQDGALVRNISLPTKISTPEGLAYDAANNRFFVSTGASPDIYVVSATGALLETITVLRGFPNPVGGVRVVPKGLELAPSSDGSGKLSLWVTDYGRDQKADGRVIEIRLDQRAAQTQSLTVSAADEQAAFDGSAAIEDLRAPPDPADLKASIVSRLDEFMHHGPNEPSFDYLL